MQPLPVPDPNPSTSELAVRDDSRPPSPPSISLASTAPTFAETAKCRKSEEMPRKCGSKREGEHTGGDSADEATAITSSTGARSAQNYAATQSVPARSGKQKSRGVESAKWYNKFGAIELENTGSVARDHLALERTFLAWLRTSLAFASIGVAITQLFRLNAAIPPESSHATTLRNMGKPLGATFLGIAILVLTMGLNRYCESQSWLLKGKFPASRGSIFLLTLIAVLLIVASLVIVLAVDPAQYGN